MEPTRSVIWTIVVSLAAFDLLTAAQDVTNASPIGNIPNANSTNNLPSVAERIQNAFKFIMLAKAESTTSNPTTPTITSGQSSDPTTAGYFMTVFETTAEESANQETTTPEATTSIATKTTSKSSLIPFSPTTEGRKATTTEKPTQRTTTTESDEDTTADFITVYETTFDPDDEKTTAEKVKSTTSTTRRTTLPPRTTRRTTTIKRTTQQTTKKSKDGDTVYVLNKGLQFIIKTPTTTPPPPPPPTTTTTRTTQHKSKKTTTSATTTTRSSQDADEIVTDDPEIWEEDYTTDVTNGSAVLAGGAAGVIPGKGGPFGGIVLSGEEEVVYFFPSPAKFWAKYWYWILIVLLLVIFLFIIPGFFCQIYLSKWCKKRKLDRFFEKRSNPIFRFERIGLGLGLGKRNHDIEDIEDASGGSFSSSGTRSRTSASNGGRVSSHHSNGSTRVPASSLPEADIHQQENSITKPLEVVTSGSEAPTVIVIPNPMRESRLKRRPSPTRLPGLSQTVDAEPSFEFPEPANDDFRLPPISPGVPSSILSQSDINLDIGNEAIIKSNKIAKTREENGQKITPARPPKPEHMQPVSKPPEIAPSNRPRKPSPSRPRKKRETQEGHLAAPPNRDRKTEDTTTSRRKEKSRKSRVKRSVKKKENPKKRTVSSTQSIMDAAKSLEDILEAITKLTREYPIPQLAETNGDNGKTKKREKKRRRRPRKSRSREQKDADLEKKYFSDEDMMRRKERRTKNWAEEQKKIEKNRAEKKSERKTREKGKRDELKPRKKRKEVEPETDENEKEEESSEKDKKIPTLVKEEAPSLDKTKQERRRMRLERDLKKLQKYHNSVAKKSADNPEEEAK